MSLRKRRVTTRWTLALFGTLWTAATVLALLSVHSANLKLVEELVADTTVLPVVFTGFDLIRRYWPADLSAVTVGDRLPRAVAQVRVGPIVVGAAFRVRGRLVVTSARVVNLALNRTVTETTAPASAERISLRFEAGRGADREVNVSAQVLEWGPARNDHPGDDIAVLRTLERLPRRIPRLRITGRGHTGRARIVLPAAEDDAASPPPYTDVRIRDHRLSPWAPAADPPIWPSDEATGAPVVAVDTEDAEPSGLVVAVYAATAPGPSAHPGTGPALVEGAAVRAAAGAISRRELLQTGTVVGGLVALGGAGTLAATSLISSGTYLRGAGWDSLFEDEAVHKYLHNKGFRIDTDLPKLSGIQSLDPEIDVSQFDFITAPNQFIADELAQRDRAGFRGAIGRPICNEEMVVLARRPAAEVLGRAGLLVRPGGGSVEMFDMTAYLTTLRQGTSWSQVGLNDLATPGDLIRVASSDPTAGGGGQMLLWLLAQTQARMTPPGDERRLWGPNGPFSGLGPDESVQLLDLLETGQEQLIFIYEHDALRWLLNRRDRIHGYVLLRTSPVAQLQQCILADNEAFAKLFSTPDDEFSRILVDRFSVRIPGRSAAIDQLLTGPLAPAVWNGHQAAAGPQRWGVQLRPRAIRRLLKHFTDDTR